ncbi:MAG TPA: AtpZ/AtpI family protein [Thermodesulfobacteriaceae bacterium]|nr:AtpZ/AtpI family protein [Thermodesulfobacteriaceae bacterium]
MSSIKEELALHFRSLSTATTIALSVVFSVFAGVICGYYLDTRLFSGRTYPWLTVVCFLFGLAGGVKNFFILSRRFSKEADEAGKKDKREAERAGKRDDSQKHSQR